MRHYEGQKAKAFRQDAQQIYLRIFAIRSRRLSGNSPIGCGSAFARRLLGLLVDLVEGIISLLGSRSEVTGDDGKVSIKVSGLQEQIQIFRENLQEMSRDFSEIHLAYTQRKTGERNLNLTPDLNYPEEIQNYLQQVEKMAGNRLASSLAKEGWKDISNLKRPNPYMPISLRHRAKLSIP